MLRRHWHSGTMHLSPVTLYRCRTALGIGIFIHYGTGLTGCRTVRHSAFKRIVWRWRRIHPAPLYCWRWRGIHPARPNLFHTRYTYTLLRPSLLVEKSNTPSCSHWRYTLTFTLLTVEMNTVSRSHPCWWWKEIHSHDHTVDCGFWQRKRPHVHTAGCGKVYAYK